ncbi:sulfotransferase family protein [Streptomyces massasporeus]
MTQEENAGKPMLALWSVPRSRSTAFFRVMGERGDLGVVHEPFSYLAEFGRCEVEGRQAATEAELVAALRDLNRECRVFFKDTTDERYPGVLADQDFLARDAVHTFLIRHPKKTIASYHALNPDVRLHQLGFEALYELYEAVREATGRAPMVIDGDRFAQRPEATVRAYCEAVGLPYDAEALTWNSGERDEWAPSARWHRDASASSGVHTKENAYTVDVESDERLGGYLRHHLPFYEKLLAEALPAQP